MMVCLNGIWGAPAEPAARTYSGVCSGGQAVLRPVPAAPHPGSKAGGRRAFPSSRERFRKPAPLAKRRVRQGDARMALTEKREARKSIRQSGWITLDGGFAARPCTVLDLSSAGARISID